MKTRILSLSLFLFPLFFLPFTSEYFFTNKLYLLSVLTLFLLGHTAYELLNKREIKFKMMPLDGFFLLFPLAILLSTIIMSQNKFQTIFTPGIGLISTISLSVIYFVLSRLEKHEKYHILEIIRFSTIIAGVVGIFFALNPFSGTNLPSPIAFLKITNFNTFGNPIELSIFLGFFLINDLFTLKNRDRLYKGSFFIILLGFISTLYIIAVPLLHGNGLLLPSYGLSWIAALEILKQPLTAVFGAGIGNFTYIFTKVKDVAYNQSSAWEISSYSYSHSALLQIFAETGILGTAILFLFIKKIIVLSKHNSHLFTLIAYAILTLAFLPITLTSFLILILVASIIENTNVKEYTFSLPFAIRAVLALFLTITLIANGYVLSKTYIAEIYYKNALDQLNTHQIVQKIFQNEQKAITFNPYNETYHLQYAQTSLLAAQSLVSTKKTLSDNERSFIAQAIQNAINQDKIAVSLNPYNASYWNNLGNVYKSLISIAKDSDTWAITAYKQAIQLDPLNPSYTFNLASLSYQLGQYDDAQVLFQRTIALKSHWPNAFYNLSWSYYQKGNYQKAASTMQTVIQLLSSQKTSADYKQAQNDLEKFKNKLTAVPKTQSNSSLQVPEASSSAQLEPKIQLKEASPSAH